MVKQNHLGRTQLAIVEYVTSHPGCTKGDAIRTVSTDTFQLAQRRRCLNSLVNRGIIELRAGLLYPGEA